HQISVKPTGLTASELSHVGVFLLRHQTRAGGEFITEFDETEFASTPDNKVFAQTREMHSNHGEAKHKLAHEIPVAYRVDAIFADARKSELARDELAVEHDCRSSNCAGAKWKDIGPFPAVAQPLFVAGEGLDLA